MPRDGSGVYSRPAGTIFSPNTKILSSSVNSLSSDIAADLNTARPIVAGGTGATTATAALSNLGALPAAGGNVGGPITMSMSAGEMLVLKAISSTGLGYMRWQDETGTAIGYIGLDNRTGNNLALKRNSAGNIDINAGSTSSGSLTVSALTFTYNGSPVATYGSANSFTASSLTAGTPSASGATVGIGFSDTLLTSSKASTTTLTHVRYCNPNGTVGTIVTSGASTTYNTTSDGRFKVNRTPLDEELDVGSIIDQLQPLAFDWLSQVTQQPTGERGIGFIAQDVHDVVPEAAMVGNGTVGQDDFVPWSLDMSRLVPYHTAEIKSLRQRAAELETTVADLLQRVSALEGN